MTSGVITKGIFPLPGSGLVSAHPQGLACTRKGAIAGQRRDLMSPTGLHLQMLVSMGRIPG
jgi:hypothetical protein